MYSFIQYLLLLIILLASVSSCTLTRIVVFFKPTINDHKKVFVCDTVYGNSLHSDAVSSIDRTTSFSNPLFVNAHSPSNIPPIDKWVPLEERLGTKNLDELLQKSKTTALIVIKKDSILYERYLRGSIKEEPHVVFSVTKAITATLTAIAAEEGHLSLDQKVAEFLPEFATDERKHISLRHLLGMESGLDWNDFADLLRLGSLYYTPNQKRFVAKAAKAKYEPGTKFTYKSLSTQILGLCLQKAIKTSLADYLEEKIWKPVGMEYTALVTLDSKKNRNARTFGGLALAAPDMARFGKLMLNNGVWNGKQIVPEWFVKDLKSRDLNKWFGYSNCFWRNGYETENLEKNQQYWAAGYGGQYIYISPQDSMVIVRTGTNEKNRWSILLGRLSNLIGQGKTDLSDPRLDYGEQFAGKYKNKAGKEMTLVLHQERDKYNRRLWTWTRDKAVFEEGKKHKILYQLDGVSLGYKKQDVQTRFYYHIEEGQVKGFYYNSWPAVALDYFEKID